MNNPDRKSDIKKRAYKFALDIIKFVDSLNKSDFATQVIIKQLLRSCTSIGANSIESQSASSRKYFTNFVFHALKSANESKFWLGLLRDSKKADPHRINELLEETTEIANILGSSIITLKGKRKT